MNKLTVVIAGVGLAAFVPVASADTAQIELLPRVGGSEIVEYVVTLSPSGLTLGDDFFYASTGGVSAP